MTHTVKVKRGKKAIFPIPRIMASQRKLDMAGIHSTVGKRAKRLLDTTVETSIVKNKNGFKIAGQRFSKSFTMW